MLARLLRVFIVALIALAAGWAWHFSQRGSPGLAVAGALLILFCHAPVMAVEFALLSWLNRDDPAPQATPVQLLAAWWGEVRMSALVFGWLQPFRSKVWPDLVAARGPPPSTQRGVLLVHGYVCNRGLWNPWLERLHAQGVPCIAVDLEPVFGSIDDYAAIIDAAAARLFAATGQPIVVVAHSMGGLAVRAWLDAHAPGTLVHRVVTIGSPHRGTFLARFGLTRNAVQMRLGGDWHGALATRELAQRELARGAALFTCFYGHCDNVVFPASTATLPGADNRHLAACAHVQMAYHPAVFSEVWRWLATARPAACGDDSGDGESAARRAADAGAAR